jgi:hypothetical protein
MHPMIYLDMSDMESDGDLSEEEAAKEGVSCKKKLRTAEGMTANRKEQLRGYKYRNPETNDDGHEY